MNPQRFIEVDLTLRRRPGLAVQKVNGFTGFARHIREAPVTHILGKEKHVALSHDDRLHSGLQLRVQAEA